MERLNKNMLQRINKNVLIIIFFSKLKNNRNDIKCIEKLQTKNLNFAYKV